MLLTTVSLWILLGQQLSIHKDALHNDYAITIKSEINIVSLTLK